MTYNYARMAQTALRMITKYGRDINVVTPSAGTYDPATGETTGGAPTKEKVKAVFTEFERHEIDGTNILTTDKKVLIAAKSISSAPLMNQKIEDDGATFNIINTVTIKPGNTDLLYEVQVRR